MRSIFALVVAVSVLPIAAAIAGLETPGPAPSPSAEPGPASLDDIPSAKPQDVARLLRKVRMRHGDDAAVIQTHLLLNAMQKGSVLATGVRVDRVEEKHGKRYLGFMLETGLVFDDTTRDRTTRAQILWATIMEPTLARLEDGLQVNKADGMMVQMQYFHRPYRSADELRTTIDKPGTSEEARFYVQSTDLDSVIRGELTLHDLVTRTKTTIDGADVAVQPAGPESPLTPGPE